VSEADDMAESQFAAHFSVWGRTLDVDAILHKAKPQTAHSVWRRGEPAEFGPATTSGIQIPVFPGGTRAALLGAVERFLRREARFLSRVHRVARRGTCVQFNVSVFAEQFRLPVGVELPPRLMRRIMAIGASWVVLAIPCGEDGTIQVSKSDGAVEQGDEADER
jgi:hypothetical protein